MNKCRLCLVLLGVCLAGPVVSDDQCRDCSTPWFANVPGPAIVGTVRFNDEPVEGCEVMLVRHWGRDVEDLPIERSDPDGRFALFLSNDFASVMDSGEYWLSVDCGEGYALSGGSWVIPSLSFDSSQIIVPARYATDVPRPIEIVEPAVLMSPVEDYRGRRRYDVSAEIGDAGILSWSAVSEAEFYTVTVADNYALYESLTLDTEVALPLESFEKGVAYGVTIEAYNSNVTRVGVAYLTAMFARAPAPAHKPR